MFKKIILHQVKVVSWTKYICMSNSPVSTIIIAVVGIWGEGTETQLLLKNDIN